MLAFVRPRQRAAGKKKVVRAASSRAGIGLVMLAYACVWTFVFPRGFHKSQASLIASILVGPLAVALAWFATRHLDKQWRLEAALSEDHELITTGPYHWIRNPIYTSMFGMLLQTGLVKAWWPLLLAAIVFYIVGTEIRVRAEERLLADRFREKYTAYRQSTWAYIPFLR